jgi:hypothetical protein
MTHEERATDLLFEAAEEIDRLWKLALELRLRIQKLEGKFKAAEGTERVALFREALAFAEIGDPIPALLGKGIMRDIACVGEFPIEELYPKTGISK